MLYYVHFLCLVLFICCWDIKNHKKETRSEEWNTVRERERKVHKSSVLNFYFFLFHFVTNLRNKHMPKRGGWGKKKVKLRDIKMESPYMQQHLTATGHKELLRKWTLDDYNVEEGIAIKNRTVCNNFSLVPIATMLRYFFSLFISSFSSINCAFLLAF